MKKMEALFGQQIMTVNYRTTPNWDEDVLRLTDNIGVDLVVENGGSSSLVKSLKCTRRGGIVSQVGYLGKPRPEDLAELVSTIIDRRVILRQGLSIFFDVLGPLTVLLEASTLALCLIWRTSVPLSKPRKCNLMISSIKSTRSTRLRKQCSLFGRER